jgi:CTP synthase (UTP-ammonia lyase)
MIEIDEVRNAFEGSVSASGDFVSDMYYDAIDLSTSPRLISDDQEKLASAIRRLNRHLGVIARIMEWHELTDVYNSVAKQLNSINANNQFLGQIHLIESDTTEKHSYSSDIIWSN